MTFPWSREPRDAPAYVDTRAGLVAADGTRYRTTEPLLRDYAGPVVEAVGLGVLLERAGIWLRAPQTLAALALPVLLLVLPWWGAAAVALLLVMVVAVAAPGVVAPGLIGALRVLEWPIVQGLLYIVALSVFASAGQFAAVWTGVAGFVALRLGLVAAVTAPFVQPIQEVLYPLPAPDMTLRSLIVRLALSRGVNLAGMEAIEDRVRAFWRRGK